ncbi:MAG TPA: TonB-dependent receptor, partial [Cellvibrio sp.]
YGGGLKINTADNAALGIRVVTGAESSGNPYLNPWRATNFDASTEYYFGDASMAYVGVFKLDVDSFVTGGKTKGSFPDQDGVIRREVDVSQPIQGKGASIEGLEVGTKLAFSDFSDGFLSNFGVDSNYTYSPSEQAAKDLSGDKLPFNDNSENQFNLIGWYQDEKLQVRVAYNYRSDRLVGQAAGAVAQFQKAIGYVDANVSYDVLDNVTVYLNGSNITGEIEEYYADFSTGDTQYLSQNEFEPRYTLGVRAKF